MTTIGSIEEFLNIETGDRKLCDGKYKHNKNRYYYFKNRYYIIKLSGHKWMIASDCRRTRRLLRNHTWYNQNGYSQSGKDIIHFHREVINTDDDLFTDHINNKTFDNRVDNLRMVTAKMNMRNKTKHKNNTSGKQGVCHWTDNKSGLNYWKVVIHDNDGKRIQKHFSIKKLGNDEAKRQAIECRKSLEQQFGCMGDQKYIY